MSPPTGRRPRHFKRARADQSQWWRKADSPLSTRTSTSSALTDSVEEELPHPGVLEGNDLKRFITRKAAIATIRSFMKAWDGRIAEANLIDLEN